MAKTVLITGASGGFGLEFARLFAKDGYSLVLVARNRDKLIDIAQDFENTYKTETKILVKDLSHPNASKEIFESLEKNNIMIDVLVNNAGFATYGKFAELELQNELNEIQVNITTLVHLTKLFLPNMLQQKSGKILNVASVAGFLPGPLMAVYYASKAFVLSFSQALGNEMEGTGVSITTLCPGPSKTGFVKRAAMERSKLFKTGTMDASLVAKIGYDGLMAGKKIVIPGFKNKLSVEVLRFAPKNMIPKVVRRLQEKF